MEEPSATEYLIGACEDLIGALEEFSGRAQEAAAGPPAEDPEIARMLLALFEHFGPLERGVRELDARLVEAELAWGMFLSRHPELR